MFWGYSPALDLLLEYFNFLREKPSRNGVNNVPQDQETDETERENQTDNGSSSTESERPAGNRSLDAEPISQNGSLQNEGLHPERKLSPLRSQHAQADHPSDDGCRGVIRIGEDGDHRRPEEGEEDGPVPSADDHFGRQAARQGAHVADCRRHVDFNGTVHVPSEVVRHDPVCPDVQVGESYLCRDTDRHEEVSGLHCAGPALQDAVASEPATEPVDRYDSLDGRLRSRQDEVVDVEVVAVPEDDFSPATVDSGVGGAAKRMVSRSIVRGAEGAAGVVLQRTKVVCDGSTGGVRAEVLLCAQNGGSDSSSDMNQSVADEVKDRRMKTEIWDPFHLFDGVTQQRNSESAGGEDGALNILLLGMADARHILKTLSCLHRHHDELRMPKETGASPRPIRIYVAEAIMELVARQLLLILAALEPDHRLGKQEKVRLMMEVLGNSLVRPTTAQWLHRAAALLVHLVTDSSALARRLPLVDLSNLRHQDRDRLEEILTFYQQRPQGFRIGFHWDQRLRRHLKARYDNRVGAFDWDYFMCLRDIPGGDKICVQEYRHWRETGVAFTWLEAEPTEPNLSLAAGVFREGSRMLHGGYLGDIVTSPYIAYAVKLDPVDNDEMFRKANDNYVKRSTDVAERNLARITYELQHQEHYVPPRDVDAARTGVLLTEVTDESRLNPEAPADDDDDVDPTLRSTWTKQVKQDSDMMSYTALTVPNAQVIFLSPKFLRKDARHAYARRFDVAVLGRGLADKQIDASLRSVLAPGGLLLVEGTRFLLERRDDQARYAQTVADLACEAGFRPHGEYDPLRHDNALFVAP